MNYGTKLWASPVVANGIVYVATSSGAEQSDVGYLYAIDAKSGKILDTLDKRPGTQESLTGIYGTPCVSDGLIYVTTRAGGSNDQGQLLVLSLEYDQQTGSYSFVEEWSYTCPNQYEWILGSPSVYDGAVYFGTAEGDKRFRTIDLITKEDRSYAPSAPWPMLGVTPGIDVSVAILGQPIRPRAYISDYSCGVTAINCDTGAYAWEDPYYWIVDGASMFASPVIYDGFVFVGSDFNCLYKFKDDGFTVPGNPNRLPQPDDAWRFTTGGTVRSTPAAWNGNVYFGCSNSRLYRVNTGSLTEQGSPKTLDSEVPGSPAISNPTGMLFIGSLNGVVYALDASDLTNLTPSHYWSFNIHADTVESPAGGQFNPITAYIRSSPALVDGQLYIIAGDSNCRFLYCFGD